MFNPGDPSLESHPTEYFSHQQQEEFYNSGVVHASTPPNVEYPVQHPNYDFTYCETQWMYYDGQQYGQYEAYCFREAYAFSHMQVKPFPMPVSCLSAKKSRPIQRIHSANIRCAVYS